MKNTDPWLMQLREDLLHVGGKVDDAREALDSVLKEAALTGDLKDEVRDSAADLREVYEKIRAIREEIRVRMKLRE
jgi:hypothetical protein